MPRTPRPVSGFRPRRSLPQGGTWFDVESKSEGGLTSSRRPVSRGVESTSVGVFASSRLAMSHVASSRSVMSSTGALVSPSGRDRPGPGPGQRGGPHSHSIPIQHHPQLTSPRSHRLPKYPFVHRVSGDSIRRDSMTRELRVPLTVLRLTSDVARPVDLDDESKAMAPEVGHTPVQRMLSTELRAAAPPVTQERPCDGLGARAPLSQRPDEVEFSVVATGHTPNVDRPQRTLPRTLQVHPDPHRPRRPAGAL